MNQEEYSQQIWTLMQKAIQTIQNNELSYDKDNSINAVLNALILSPVNYKTVQLTFLLDAEEDKKYELHQRRMMDTLKITPSRNNLIYELPILIPRDPVIDSSSTHGSPRRTGAWSQGAIMTLKLTSDRYDTKTNDNTTLRINPMEIGALCMDKSLGITFFFPRHIHGIKLLEEMPSYLSENAKRIVGDMYTFQ